MRKGRKKRKRGQFFNFHLAHRKPTQIRTKYTRRIKMLSECSQSIAQPRKKADNKTQPNDKIKTI